MPDGMTIARLVSLDNREYLNVVKSRLRMEEEWLELLEPLLIERTRQNLQHLVASLDRQIERVGEQDPEWLVRARALRRHARNRLNRMPPAPPGTKAAREWRAFSARLARALVDNDPGAADRIITPYGGLTARQWLSTREAKQR